MGVNLKERQVRNFENKIDKSDGCWEWMGSRMKGGYGRLTLNYKSLLAHRVSWMICRKENIGEKCVLHICDNRKCVNPQHLFLGTYKDNRIDAVRKGRHYRTTGENNGRSKLTKEIVNIIRNSTLGATILADKFNVNRSQIYRVKKNISWLSE